MAVLEVFADVACPFTHVGLRRYVVERSGRGATGPMLRIRAWPLEIVNDRPLDGSALAPKIEALRASIAPDLFRGFVADRFPVTSLPALAAEAAAYRRGDDIGERFSLAIRTALFEDGADISDPAVIDEVAAAAGAPPATPADEQRVRDDYAEGRRRGVQGSPHFFAPGGVDFFCPTLDIEHHDGRIEISFDAGGFSEFTRTVWPDER